MPSMAEQGTDTRHSPGDQPTLDVGGVRVEFHRGGVRRINLRVRADGSVRVSAPTRVSLRAIEDFVRERTPWIERQRGRLSAQRQGERERWKNGSMVTLLGRSYALRITCAPMTGESAHVVDDVLLVRAKEDGLSVEDVRRIVSPLARRLLRSEVETLFARFERAIGVRHAKLRIRRMTSRWGSCNVRTATITINHELCFRPHACLECVVVHELCHLLEPSHNGRFHALMDHHYPQWRRAQAYLDAHPPLS